MVAKRLEAAAPANELQALVAIFFFGASRLIAVGVSVSCPCKVVLLSLELSWAFEIWWRREKTSLPINNGEKHGIQNRLAELHGSILRCLGPTIVQDSRSFRCSCVYFATQCNVHYGNQQTRHLLSALRLERYTAAIIFPHNKMAQKNHWIAWQCIFNLRTLKFCGSVL